MDERRRPLVTVVATGKTKPLVYKEAADSAGDTQGIIASSVYTGFYNISIDLYVVELQCLCLSMRLHFFFHFVVFAIRRDDESQIVFVIR